MLGETIMSTAARKRISRPDFRSTRPVPRPFRLHNLAAERKSGWHPGRALYIVALIALLSIGLGDGAFSRLKNHFRAAAVSTPIPATGEVPLYRINAGDGSWRRIDPVTLGAMASESGPGFPEDALNGDQTHFIAAVSRDGSTVVEQVVSRDPERWNAVSFVVYDAASKRQRSVITPETNGIAAIVSLSADGGRLTLSHAHGSSTSGADGFNVTSLDLFDTGSGRKLSSLDLTSTDADVLGAPLVDETASFVYVLTIDYAKEREMPAAAQLTKYALPTGTVAQQATLAGMTGVTDVIPTASGKPRHAKFTLPGVALSPDGQTIAAISPHGDRLTLIETADLSKGSKPIVTESGEPCVTQDGGFPSVRMPLFAGGRLVTPVSSVLPETISGGPAFGTDGFCTIDPSTGIGLYAPISHLLPPNWRPSGAFLTSDGRHLILSGSEIVEPYYETSTPTAWNVSYGDFSFDAATLKETGRDIVTTSDFFSISSSIFNEAPPAQFP